MKGVVENNLKSLGLANLAIYRPAAIVGNVNTGSFFSWLAPKFDCVLPSIYQSITVTNLGEAMVEGAARALAGKVTDPVTVYEGEPLFQLTPARSAACQQGGK